MTENAHLEFAKWKMHTMENARTEIAPPGKWQKNHTPDYDRKCTIGICQNGKCQNRNCTPWKMTEKSHSGKWEKYQIWKIPGPKLHTLENTRIENAQPGKYKNGKCTPWKMTKNPAQEIDSKCTVGICQNGKCTHWKMLERKLYPPENDRQIEPRKMTENLNLENARMEIAHPGKYQKWKITNLENTRTKITHPGKWKKNHNPENDKKSTIEICQNGKYTALKMPE